LFPDDYDPMVGTGANAYRIVFHGDVQSIRATGVDREDENLIPVQFDAVSDMSGLLNRRARCAANAGSGISTMLADIETAHSLTMDGNGAFPSGGNGFPGCDRPAQKRTTNGEYIATMLAPVGAWVIEDWAGTLTAPELRWRTDFTDPDYMTYTLTGYRDLEIGYPWLLTYEDVGFAYEDYTAKITVTGETSGGTQYYGWARLDNADGARDALSNREVQVDSYINTAADCKTWARRHLAWQGAPSYGLRMNAVTLNTEVYYKALVDQGAHGVNPTYGNAANEMMLLGTAMPGDNLYARGYYVTDVGGVDGFGSGNSDYGDWPAAYDDASDLHDTLFQLWRPWLGQVDDTSTYQEADRQTIRQVRRTFTPTGGWDITFGLVPWSTLIRGTDVGVSDTDSGTD
jgi:hypothetical protein